MNKNGLVRVGDIQEMVSHYNLSDDWSEEDTHNLVSSHDPEDTVDFSGFVALVTGEREIIFIPLVLTLHLVRVIFCSI